MRLARVRGSFSDVTLDADSSVAPTPVVFAAGAYEGESQSIEGNSQRRGCSRAQPCTTDYAPVQFVGGAEPRGAFNP